MRQLKVLLVVFLAFLSLHICANETDSLLRELDMSIRNRPQYTLKRQEQIDALQRKLRLSHSDQERYDLYRELFGKYRSYRMDSALWVANQRVELAKRMKNPLYIYSAELNIAEVMIGVAMYKEGLEILDEIKSADLDDSGVSYYYYQYHQVYTLMADYAFSDQMKEHYRGLAYQYKDSIISMRRPGSQGYLLMMSEKLLYEEKYDEAIEILNSCYKTHEEKIQCCHSFYRSRQCLCLYGEYRIAEEISGYFGYCRYSGGNEGIHLIVEVSEPSVSGRRYKACLYLYRMLYARRHLLQCTLSYTGDFRIASRYQPDVRKQAEGGENTDGCSGHPDICPADYIAGCSDVHFLSDEAVECSPESGEHYE